MLTPLLALPLLVSCVYAADLRGVVLDASGAPVPRAQLSLAARSGAAARESISDGAGRFWFVGIEPGRYVLSADAPGFQRAVVRVEADAGPPLELRLNVAAVRSEVSVTAQRGDVQEIESAAQVSWVRDQAEAWARPVATLGNALEYSPGVMVQQTTYGQASPFLRGLTGYQTLLLVDGIRLNTSIFRTGPNQYLTFVTPGLVDALEVVLGPAAASYGSDSMGGAVGILTRPLPFGSARGWTRHGDLQAAGSSAGMTVEGSAYGSIARDNIALSGGWSGRRLNDLRPGRGIDSRNVFTRYFGLSGESVKDLLGSRLQDTGYGQMGVSGKAALRISPRQTAIAHYQHNRLGNVRSYQDQLGGAGRVLALFTPQALSLGYLRYELLNPGILDSFTATFSANEQQDGTERGGIRFSDTVTADSSRVLAFGYSAQVTAHWGRRNLLVAGGDLYDDRVHSTRFLLNPVTGVSTQTRALYPNGSRYRLGGAFIQTAAEFVPDRFRASAGIRLTTVSFRTFAHKNETPAGTPLGVIDSSGSLKDFTYHGALSGEVTRNIGLSAVVSRGFRAPNITDLGSVGLSALTYDVTTEQARDAGALVGLDGSDTTGSRRRTFSNLRGESLLNYEFGVRVHTDRVTARLQGFLANLNDPISGRTLLFPVGSIPATVGGVPVTPIGQSAAQRAEGVAAVATSFGPRAMKAPVNDGGTRYYGLDVTFRALLGRRWSADGTYSYLVGRDLNPNRHVRRLPPQIGSVALRYTPSSRRFWSELALRAAGPQDRLSGGDIDDDRIGASRRRRDIADFFGGDYARPFIENGVFLPTGETLRQIQDRVLPPGASINGVRVTDDGARVPLFLRNPGWWTLELHGGMPLGERLSLSFGVVNLLDRNYRVLGSGIDGPGINAYAGFRYSF